MPGEVTVLSSGSHLSSDTRKLINHVAFKRVTDAVGSARLWVKNAKDEVAKGAGKMSDEGKRTWKDCFRADASESGLAATFSKLNSLSMGIDQAHTVKLANDGYVKRKYCGFGSKGSIHLMAEPFI